LLIQRVIITFCTGSHQCISFIFQAPLLGKGQVLFTELKLQFLELNILPGVPAINPSPGPKLSTVRSFSISGTLALSNCKLQDTHLFPVIHRCKKLGHCNISPLIS
jgi:hypothetical protein